MKPSPSWVRADLARIRRAGFTGVVTFGSNGTLADIPALAKEQGLAVIMGIWQPTNQGEILRAARKQAFVDAYCVGHNGLDKGDGYVFEDLEEAIKLLRKLTGRPIATSEEARIYADNNSLCRLGDWLFPDLHQPLWDSPGARVEIEQDVKDIVEAAKPLATIAKMLNRPLLFKNVAYPWKGATGASLDAQRRFFVQLRQTLNDPKYGLPYRAAALRVSQTSTSPPGRARWASW